eukprot:3295325-Pleurochrysis_carterae.AAC.10
MHDEAGKETRKQQFCNVWCWTSKWRENWSETWVQGQSYTKCPVCDGRAGGEEEAERVVAQRTRLRGSRAPPAQRASRSKPPPHLLLCFYGSSQRNWASIHVSHVRLPKAQRDQK